SAAPCGFDRTHAVFHFVDVAASLADRRLTHGLTPISSFRASFSTFRCVRQNSAMPSVGYPTVALPSSHSATSYFRERKDRVTPAATPPLISQRAVLDVRISAFKDAANHNAVGKQVVVVVAPFAGWAREP